jgi:outer membrane protein assembly factor BamE (lipoprotein component of BamABCDE complex)
LVFSVRWKNIILHNLIWVQTIESHRYKLIKKGGTTMKCGKLFLSASMISIILILSCASYLPHNEPVQKSNLTSGTVKKEITKGKTTQAEVMQLFGSPNLMTMDSDGNEVWNYNKMSYTTTAGSDGTSLSFWSGSRSIRSSTTQSFDLIIVFDKSNVVRDYRVISASY